MKSWLIVLVPIVIFGALLGPGLLKPSPAKDKGKAAHKAQGKTAEAPAADAPTTDAAATTPETAAPTKPATTPTKETPKPEPAAATPVVAPLPTVDPAKGNARLAKLWNEMDATALNGIVEKWKDEDLAKVLAVMDNAKVVELLGQMKLERASALSKELQKLASVVPPTPTPAQS